MSGHVRGHCGHPNTSLKRRSGEHISPGRVFANSPALRDARTRRFEASSRITPRIRPRKLTRTRTIPHDEVVAACEARTSSAKIVNNPDDPKPSLDANDGASLESKRVASQSFTGGVVRDLLRSACAAWVLSRRLKEETVKKRTPLLATAAGIAGVLVFTSDALATDYECAAGGGNSPWHLAEYNTYKTLWGGGDNRYYGIRYKGSNGQITWQQLSTPVPGGQQSMGFINSPAVNVRRQSGASVYSVVSHNIQIYTYNNVSLINCQQGTE